MAELCVFAQVIFLDETSQYFRDMVLWIFLQSYHVLGPHVHFYGTFACYLFMDQQSIS